MRNKGMRKRLSDFRFLNNLVEVEVKRQNAWIPRPTLTQANEMFEIGRSAIDVPILTQKGRKRRVAEIAWRSVVNELRKKNPSKKRKKGQSSSSSSSAASAPSVIQVSQSSSSSSSSSSAPIEVS